MKLFKQESNKLGQLSIKPFKLERDIQSLVESNLSELFDLKFIKSEVAYSGFRFDTLCFDEESKSLVIVEYKKGSSYSVIDQGYTYLSLLLNNKSDFYLEYLSKFVELDEVDWSQTKVIFISPQFSEFQKNSINFKNLPFELWEITRYENDSVSFNKITSNSNVDINTAVGSKDDKSLVSKVSKEVVHFSEDYHFNKNKNRPPGVVELYYKLKDRILNLGEQIEFKAGKQTIGFRQNKIFCDLIIYNGGVGIMINLKKGMLKDELGKTEDLSEKGHWGNGDYRIWLSDDSDLDYAISLVKQSFDHQSL